MKKLFLQSGLLLCIIMSTTVLSAQDTLILDKIIAKVGGEVIFHSDVEEQIAMMKERKGNPGFNDRCLILESLLAQSMLVHYARIDSVEVTDEEVEAEIDQRMNQILAMMNNDRKMFQEVYGQTVSEMREQVKDDMTRKLLGDRMQQTIINSVEVTPAEVLDYYTQIPADSLPYFNAEVELAEIVVYPEVNELEREKALQKINKLKEQIKAGESFSELAIKYSDDGSSREGGNLGWTSRGNFVPEFEAAAFQLEKGDVSDVIETEYGFHLIQLIDRQQWHSQGVQFGSRYENSPGIVSPAVTDPVGTPTIAAIDKYTPSVRAGSRLPHLWREDGTFSGGWRPNPGADEAVNVPYDIGGHRLG